MSDYGRQTSGVRRIAIGCLTLPLVLAVLVSIASVAGAPPGHDSITVGGHSIAYEVATSSMRIFGPIAPTTSLADARCEAWLQGHTGDCPDKGTLAAAYWPDLQVTPRTLYIGVQGFCDLDPHRFNLEVNRPFLVLHCRQVAPWVNLRRVATGASAAPLTSLLIVSTATWLPDQYWIYREDRVERWFFDSVTQTVLGVVSISPADT
jgi:hypothetical protein